MLASYSASRLNNNNNNNILYDCDLMMRGERVLLRRVVVVEQHTQAQVKRTKNEIGKRRSLIQRSTTVINNKKHFLYY